MYSKEERYKKIDEFYIEIKRENKENVKSLKLNEMKKLLFLLVIATLITSCEKDPDFNQLDSDFTVYTNYDSDTQFSNFTTFCLPDSILLAGQSVKAHYWKDDNAQKIINTVADEMLGRGYTRVEKPADASIGLQLSYAEQTTQIIGTIGGGYGGWWDFGFWGPYWGGWYYPYPISYSYDTGTFIMELVDLTDKPSDKLHKANLPVVWHAYASGLLYGNSHINIQLTLNAVTQAFEQSPYINK